MKQKFLEQIIATKTEEVALLKQNQSLIEFTKKPIPNTQKNAFKKALQKPGLSLIAEIKKASPSKGIIRNDFDPKTLAKHFEANGASALSILTDEQYFQGHPSYIKAAESSLPKLRKEFIIDPIQVYQSAQIGAQAILLIKSILTRQQYQELNAIAQNLDLDVLLELHSPEEWESIRDCTPDIIGINNRNLHTFEMTPNLAEQFKSNIQSQFSGCIVAESGYSQTKDLDRLNASQFDAVLIGEGLAKQPDLLSYFKDKKHEN